MSKNKNWGLCDIDYNKCFSKGAICRLNPNSGFVMEHTGQGKKEPFRNKDCSHFKKDNETLSEYEKVRNK
ncbi:MAG TPA: hypothetical protein VGB37_09755 [Candidatus Lokiarchaeia archaeon]